MRGAPLLALLIGLSSPALAAGSEEVAPEAAGAAAAPGEAAPPARLKLALMDVAAGPGVKPAAAEAASAWVEGWLSTFDVYEMISADQLRTMLSFEAQKQLLGCDTDGCTSEISGALDTDRLLTGTLTRVGTSARLNLTLIDPRASRRLASTTRVVRVERTIEPLLLEVAEMVHELLGKDPALDPLPPLPRTKPVPPPTVSNRSYPTLAEVRQDPRNGFALFAAGGFQAGRPIVSLGIHGQGGAVGMGLVFAFFDPGATSAAYAIRPQLRVMPGSWRFLAPFVGVAGGAAFFKALTVENPARFTDPNSPGLCKPDDVTPENKGYVNTPCRVGLLRATLGPRLGLQLAWGHLIGFVQGGYDFAVRTQKAFVDLDTEPVAETLPLFQKGPVFELGLGVRL